LTDGLHHGHPAGGGDLRHITKCPEYCPTPKRLFDKRYWGEREKSVNDLKLFRVVDGQSVEIAGSAVALERHLQTLIEANMEAMLGIRFLASEYATGPRHRGRIDSLGLDENGNPAIIEYKKTADSGILPQAASYLSWLCSHITSSRRW
jgi:hypothetical protein